MKKLTRHTTEFACTYHEDSEIKTKIFFIITFLTVEQQILIPGGIEHLFGQNIIFTISDNHANPIQQKLLKQKLFIQNKPIIFSNK
jgi:hypothetical protein